MQESVRGTCIVSTKNYHYNYTCSQLLYTCSAQKQLAMHLWEAVTDDNVIKVRSLLEQGANPNHQLYWSTDSWGKYVLPPVHKACQKGYLEITRVLVRCGADIERGDELMGETAFNWACEGGHMELVVYLSQDIKCRIGKSVSVT